MTAELLNKIKDSITELDNGSLLIDAASWEKVSKYIKDDLNFDYLMCVTSYDLYPENKLGLAYNFYSNSKKILTYRV